MKNFVQTGNQLTFTASDLIHPTHTDGFPHSGDPVVVGRIAGVAMISALASTDLVSVLVEGVVNVSVVGSGNGISVGETVFIDYSAATLGPDLTDVPFGIALQAIAAGQTANINVKLFGGTPGALGANS